MIILVSQKKYFSKLTTMPLIGTILLQITKVLYNFAQKFYTKSKLRQTQTYKI